MRQVTTCALAALLAAGASPAFAGGLPDDDGGSLKDTGDYGAPAPIWTGFYFGAHAGYADGEWDGTTKTSAGNPDDSYSGIDESDQSIDGSGWFAGGQIGANWQRGNVVLGVEGDVSWTNFDGSGTWTAYDDGEGYAWRKEHDLSVDYFGTARVRLGYAAGTYMPYVTGGLAWAKTSGDLAVTYFDQESDAVDGTSHGDADETHLGWTIGGGVEAMLGDRWSAKAEYLYVNLGEEEYRFGGETYNGDPFDTDYYESDLDFHTIRLGLNYRLN